MRTEQTLLGEITAWAMEDPNIRTVLLAGSRAEPGRTPDRLSDYDVELFVRDSAPFGAHDGWVRRFGEVMVRWPLSPRPTGREGVITQLVLYRDGVRVDFQVTALPPESSPSVHSGYRILVDKDRVAPRLPAPDPVHYLIQPPTAEAFAGRLNAFWWDVIYVAKALRRGELNYARYMLEGPLRFEILLPLLEWYAGLRHDWTVQAGIYGRWLERLLDDETWQAYTATFAGPAPADHRRAMWAMVALVRRLGRALGQALGHPYPEETDRHVSAYLERLSAAGDSILAPPPAGERP
ncbi:MAG: aminoglycoside 6-adenylyltransferase [Candidatus Promineifilaceae bacterium]|nr:aminoglycoside 6-adenylyltransferase [Candidatus Promineifilaceae bacterium]